MIMMIYLSEQELTLELNLQMYWKDARLSHLADKVGNKFIVLNPVLLNQIWHPDIFLGKFTNVTMVSINTKF
jgi:hypothetical protein